MPREAEVGHLHRVAGLLEQNVRGLQVSVKNAAFVQVVHGGHHLAEEPLDLEPRQDQVAGLEVPEQVPQTPVQVLEEQQQLAR